MGFFENVCDYVMVVMWFLSKGDWKKVVEVV